MTERYVGGHRFFKKTYKTLSAACQSAQSGDTLILNGGSMRLNYENSEALVHLPSGNIVVDGHNTTISIPHNVDHNLDGLIAGGNCDLTLKDMTINVGEQVIGLILGAFDGSLSGNVVLENCKIKGLKKAINPREVKPLILAKAIDRGADSISDRLLPAHLKLVNCDIDFGYLYAQQIEAYNCKFGSINTLQSELGMQLGYFENCQFDNTALLCTGKDRSIVKNGNLGLNVQFIGQWGVLNAQAQYHAERDKGYSKRDLKQIMHDYDLTKVQSVFTSFDFQNIKSSLAINGIDFDQDSYQAWTTRETKPESRFKRNEKVDTGSYVWFDLQGSEAILKGFKIPKIADNLTNIAGGSLILDNVIDYSKWTKQKDLKVQNRHSTSSLFDEDQMSSGALTKKKHPENAMDQLEQMIGLTSVKQQLEKMLALEKANHMREASGMKTDAANRNMIFAGPAGTGKAILDSDYIPTPKGLCQVKDIKVNDKLFDIDGKPTKVLGVYPQGMRTIYQVTLADGRQIKCSGDHIWRVKIDDVWEDKTAKELVRLVNRKQVELPRQPLVKTIAHQKLLLSPYVMGALISSSSLRNKVANLTVHNPEVVTHFVNALADSAYPIHMNVTPVLNVKRAANYWFKCCDRSLSVVGRERVRRRGLVYVDDLIKDDQLLVKREDHYIPVEYRTATVKERLMFLRGVFDCVGELDNGQLTVNSFSQQFVIDLKEILVSLGMNATIKEVKRHYILRVYNVNQLLLSDPKMARFVKQHSLYLTNVISQVKRLNQKAPMTCFFVESEQHVFVAKDYVITHNTTVAKLFAKALYQNGLIDSPHTEIVKVSRLKGEHIGESGHNMEKAIQRAMGGVLFIDEAYALNANNGNGSQDPYLIEMQNPLIHAAEDNYRDLVIILAGYLHDMQIFIQSNNEGFNSRFPNWILFPEYSPKEMAQILSLMISKGDYSYGDGAQKAVIQAAFALSKHQQRGAGNGRLMRSMYDQIRQQMALRISTLNNPTRRDLQEIEYDDVVKAFNVLQNERSIEMGDD